jgi:hypothetical protein
VEVDTPEPEPPAAPTPPEEIPVPEECQLAPVEPELHEETFEILGDLTTADYAPTESERWNWTGSEESEPPWPYPARAVWPSRVNLPIEENDDFELVAIGGASPDELYVVGRRGDAPLVLHLRDGDWLDESAAVLDGLPNATLANSISVPSPDQVWVSTKEGLVRSNGDSAWVPADVSPAVYPLGAVWLHAGGFGVVAGGTVATTGNAGGNWELETRTLGFVAPGMAYSRSFVRVAGHAERMAVVGAYGHLLTRDDGIWTASTLLGSDVAFTDEGQFVTTRSSSDGLLFRKASYDWQIYPLAVGGRAGLDRVSASPEGDVFAGGNVFAILHRFADGTVELLPSEVNELRDFHADSSRLYALAATSLWEYDLGDVSTSGVARAAVLDETLLDIAPSPESAWGQRAASNFEPLDCVDADLVDVGSPAWQGELAPDPPEARYGSCGDGAERYFSEMAFSFTAPTTGTYRIVLEEPGEGTVRDATRLELALRNGCEGWLIWGGGRGGSSAAVDIGLEQGQVLLIEVYATDEIDEPVPFGLSIY